MQLSKSVSGVFRCHSDALFDLHLRVTNSLTPWKVHAVVLVMSDSLRPYGP